MNLEEAIENRNRLKKLYLIAERERGARICFECEHFRTSVSWEEAINKEIALINRSYEAADQILRRG